MLRFLSALSLSAILGFSFMAFAAENEMPGNLIDDLMRKQNNEVASSTTPTVTAESALPQKPVTELKSVVETKSVEDQPVFSTTTPDQKIKAAPSINLWGRMFGSLAIVLVIFGGCAYGFKKWPGSKKLAVKNRMIEVLAQHYVGPRKSLAVVRVAGESVLVGITENSITMLKTLSLLDEDVPQTKEKFQSTLTKKYKESTEEPTEEFNMQGLKELVGQKLKSMREL